MLAAFFDILAGIAVLVGAFFIFAAAVGIVRMPDVYVRMHAATKAGTLGSGLILIATALHSGAPEVVARALAAVVFLVATTPVAAHLLGRAAYLSGVPTWSGTEVDELAGHYDTKSLALSSTPVAGGGEAPVTVAEATEAEVTSIDGEGATDAKT